METLPRFQNQAELNSYLNSLESRITALENEKRNLQDLVQRLNNMETLQQRSRILPQTGLLSPSFLTRAFTIWGHYFVAQLIIGLGFLAVYLVIIVLIMAAAGSH